MSFIASLLEDRDLKFKVASMPNADKFQLHIYAALAEQERDFISMRTKAALAAKKAAGFQLGGIRDKTNRRNEAVRNLANEYAQEMWLTIKPMRSAKLSFREIAKREFNSEVHHSLN